MGPGLAALPIEGPFRAPPGLTIPRACCDAWAERDPSRVAIVEGDRRWTCGELKRASDGLAAAMRARGVGRGDRVAILLPQSAAVPVAHFAAHKLGAVSLPLAAVFGADALRHRLADSGAVAAVTDAAGLDRVMALRPDLPALREVWCAEPSAVRSLWDDAAAGRLSEPEPVGAEDPAMLIYTSGTTGAAKGVLHAHRFLWGHLPLVEAQHALPRAGVAWTPADWAWIGGLMDLALPALHHGVPLVAGRLPRFDPDEAWATVARHGADMLFLPPTALRLMAGAAVPDGVAVRSVTSGGEALGEAVRGWARERLGLEVLELYGQTECNLVVGTRPGEARPEGTMGRASPGADVAVLSDGAPAAEGEVAVRRGHPAMFLGYWNRPEATAEKARGEWMMTGDLARTDGRWLWFSGRADDVITASGYRVGPGEIEEAACLHPAVALAAAVGEPDPVRTEVVVLHVVLRGPAPDDLEDALRRLVRERVGAHVVPRRVVMRDALPMTATGKVMRRVLREGG